MARDLVQPGQYYTADYLRETNLDASATFGGLFKLVHASGKSASDTGVKNSGASDTSPVFRVAKVYPDKLIYTHEYNASQTGEVQIAAPGTGKQIVIDYASIRTDGNTGEAFFHSDSVALAYKVYFSVQTSFAAGDVYVPMGENKSVKLTSTQGAKKLYVAISYHVEEI